MSAPAAPGPELDALEARIDAWLARQLAENPVVAAVDRGEPGERRWYVRLHGEDKDFSTIWLTLGQRTLRAEVYVMPAPEENQAAVYEQLLRRNLDQYGLAFAIGEEDAVFLVGRLGLAAITEDELDRLVGSVWTYVERAFQPALRLAFASRLAPRARPDG